MIATETWKRFWKLVGRISVCLIGVGIFDLGVWLIAHTGHPGTSKHALHVLMVATGIQLVFLSIFFIVAVLGYVFQIGQS